MYPSELTPTLKQDSAGFQEAVAKHSNQIGASRCLGLVYPELTLMVLQATLTPVRVLDTL